MTNRREFLLTSGGIAAGSLLLPCYAAAAPSSNLTLALQTWTFRLFDLDEGIRKTKQAGVNEIEIAGGITIGGEKKRASAMNAEERKRIKDVLQETGVKAVSLGGCQGTTQEFDFAAEFALQRLQGEPPFENLVEVSQRAEKYKVRFSLHNHAKPNKYWDYRETLKRLDNCTPFIGFCPDTGHFIRSGLDPLQTVKDLKGRIFEIHLKDLNIPDNKDGKANLHDVPWGTGQGKVKDILHLLSEEKTAVSVIIEYEYHWEDNLDEVKQCVSFFRNI
ncbi:MAG: sugar phosphate isomerase/epimerase [Planctomycetaceae bacterium]|jgi:sugar phosphate isomerase/epimerase|nr:sugar phosphate isomerase/epimerase [Planctomycetaceae bacterium]